MSVIRNFVIPRVKAALEALDPKDGELVCARSFRPWGDPKAIQPDELGQRRIHHASLDEVAACHFCKCRKAAEAQRGEGPQRLLRTEGGSIFDGVEDLHRRRPYSPGDDD